MTFREHPRSELLDYLRRDTMDLIVLRMKHPILTWPLGLSPSTNCCRIAYQNNSSRPVRFYARRHPLHNVKSSDHPRQKESQDSGASRLPNFWNKASIVQDPTFLGRCLVSNVAAKAVDRRKLPLVKVQESVRMTSSPPTPSTTTRSPSHPGSSGLVYNL